MKTLVKRIGHIEDLLGNEPSPGKLSPALQEAVDRIIGRSNTKITQEGHEGEDKDETGK